MAISKRLMRLAVCQCQRLAIPVARVGREPTSLFSHKTFHSFSNCFRNRNALSTLSGSQATLPCLPRPTSPAILSLSVSNSDCVSYKVDRLKTKINQTEIQKSLKHQCRNYATSNGHRDSQNSLRPHRLNLDNPVLKTKDVKESTDDNVKEWKEDVVFTVPNVLTSLRIVATPFLGYLVLHESYSWACGLFVAAGITDLLDGYIARNFPGQASAFGSYLDPLADKILVSILFLSLTVVNLIPLPLTVLVVLRDLLLVAAAFYVRYITLPAPKTIKRYFDVSHATAQLHPTFISKLNTAVQLSLVTFTLGAPVFGYVDHMAIQTLWYLTAATTTASGITYMFAKDTFKVLRKPKH